MSEINQQEVDAAVNKILQDPHYTGSSHVFINLCRKEEVVRNQGNNAWADSLSEQALKALYGAWDRSEEMAKEMKELNAAERSAVYQKLRERIDKDFETLPPDSNMTMDSLKAPLPSYVKQTPKGLVDNSLC